MNLSKGIITSILYKRIIFLTFLNSNTFPLHVQWSVNSFLMVLLARVEQEIYHEFLSVFHPLVSHYFQSWSGQKFTFADEQFTLLAYGTETSWRKVLHNRWLSFTLASNAGSELYISQNENPEMKSKISAIDGGFATYQYEFNRWGKLEYLLYGDKFLCFLGRLKRRDLNFFERIGNIFSCGVLIFLMVKSRHE